MSYTPIRDGGAGDEVNGIATGGSFANVWKDNNTVADDIAIRWTSSANIGDPATRGLGRHAPQGVEQLLRVGAAQRGHRR